MRFKYLIIPTAFLFQAAQAQLGSSSATISQGSPAAPATATNATQDVVIDQTTAGTSVPNETLIIDYKSVYEAATIEEEVKMATERFNLTKSQQDMWLTAATDRRAAEKQAREKLDSKNGSYERDGAYRGLRTSQNNFHEIITGYLTPAQKNALETDRLILQEKQKRLAKLPPPPPPAPTVTATPVDSAATKEPETGKGKTKKSKKKKKTTTVG